MLIKNGYFYLFLISVLIGTGCSSIGSGKDSEVKTPPSRLQKQRQLDTEAAVKAHLAAGIQYLRNGEMGHAHRHLKRALELNSESVEVHNALAIFYQAEGDDARESFHFKKALELDSENSSVMHNYGSSLCRRGLYLEARTYLTKAAVDYRYSGRAESYQNLGHCEILAENKGAARAAFENAYRLDKNLPKTLLGLSKLKLEGGENEAARQLYTRYLLLAKQNAESLWLGIQLERVFGDKNALASYELALRKRFPGSNEFKLYQDSLNALKNRP